MSDPRLSAKTGEWYSNPTELDPIRQVLGGIDLDPCGSVRSNLQVQATTVLSREGQLADWASYGETAYVNPPGTCHVSEMLGLYLGCDNPLVSKTGGRGRCSCKLTTQFLKKAVYESSVNSMDIVYMAYNISQIRQISKIDTSGASITLAVPSSRYKFLKHDTLEPGRSSAAVDSALLLISTQTPLHDSFAEAFKALDYSTWILT